MRRTHGARAVAAGLLLAILAGVPRAAPAQELNHFFGPPVGSNITSGPTSSRVLNPYSGTSYIGYYFGHGYVGPTVNYAGDRYGPSGSYLGNYTSSSPAATTFDGRYRAGWAPASPPSGYLRSYSGFCP